MNLDVSTWGDFVISDLFDKFQQGKANQGLLDDGNNCIYVGAKKDDNGVMFHCAYDKKLVQKGNCIIFICNGEGSVGYANYMNREFIGTTDIVAGYNKKLNEYNGLFIATVLCQERPKYSFGRKWKTHLKGTVIKLPKTNNNTPDWQFMEDYIKSLKYKHLTTRIKWKQHDLNVYSWKEFKVSSILTIINGCGITKEEIEENKGDFNAVQSGEENNGVLGKIDKNYCISMKYAISERPCLTVARSGSAGFVSFQPNGCVVGDSAKILLLEESVADERIYLFIQTILTSLRLKYAYGRKVTKEKYLNEIIKLPVVYLQNGEPYIDKTYKYSEQGFVPDWSYMKRFIDKLPYSDKIIHQKQKETYPVSQDRLHDK